MSESTVINSAMWYRNSSSFVYGSTVAVTKLALVLLLVACTGEESAEAPVAGADDVAAEAAPGAPNAEAPAVAPPAPGAPNAEAQAVAPPAPAATLVEWPGAGKYGCSESISRMVNGSFEYTPEGRGFLTIDGRGGYVDPYGVAGSYRAAGAQESHFSGGALDDAVVTPLEGDDPRLWVVIPTESGERRWSCTFTDE